MHHDLAHNLHAALFWVGFSTVVIGACLILAKLVDRLLARQRPIWMIGCLTCGVLAALLVFKRLV